MKPGVNATRIGAHACRYLAAGIREGCIASTFRHGFNAIFEEGRAPVYVAIQTPAVPLHPWAIEVPAIPPSIAVGAPIRAADHTLAVTGFSFSTLQAACDELRLAPWVKEQAVATLSRLPHLRALTDQKSAERVPDPFQPQIDTTLAQWRAAHDPAALLGLVGLGIGSTPSGDDLLVGILAGLTALSEVSASAKRQLEALRQTVAGGSLRTHSASGQMLAAAVDGSFPEPLLDLARGLGGAGHPEAARAAGRVLGLGATSGSSFLAGLVAALDANP